MSPSPAFTPTNLVFNIAATPGGLLRFWREQRDTTGLLGLLVDARRSATDPVASHPRSERSPVGVAARAGGRVRRRDLRDRRRSLLAPILLAAGFSAYEVAPATLAATFLTSIAGIAAYEVLQLSHGGTIAPDWALGVWLSAGVIAVRYVQEGVQPAHAHRPAAVAH